MAEAGFDPVKEGQRIAQQYLSSLGWGREWQRTIAREVRPAYTREEMETKFQQAEQRIENAEERFSSAVDRYLRDPSPGAKMVLETILKLLGQRHDLGFFAKQMIGHIKHRLGIQ